MSVFDELQWRGMVNQTTHDELAPRLSKERFVVYCGFDPTAESLHIGHLLAIKGLCHFQRHGHQPIALVGGATGLIGDPSGKSEERQLLSMEAIEANVAGIGAQLDRFLDFTGENAAKVRNNADWLGQWGLLEFLRDIGKHFSVNVLLSRDSVRQRLEERGQGMSYTEFSYTLLQSYDFLHLYDTEGCRLQIGGSDQWGNIVAGMDLTRRLREGAETFGLTFPLVTKADGGKFGKTEAGTVWLSPERTSPYKFYQFWVNAPDADVVKFLRYFTFLEREAIEELAKSVEEAPERRAAQYKLAEEVTRWVHGEEELQKAIKASNALFGGAIRGLDAATLEDVFSEAPSAERPRAELGEGRPLVEVLVDSGVVKSKGEARRLIQNGGLYLNNERVTDEAAELNENSLITDTMAVIRKGKKQYHLLRFTG